jgi:hypothetical protein
MAWNNVDGIVDWRCHIMHISVLACRYLAELPRGRASTVSHTQSLAFAQGRFRQQSWSRKSGSGYEML